jgi:hypothetical protein
MLMTSSMPMRRKRHASGRMQLLWSNRRRPRLRPRPVQLHRDQRTAAASDVGESSRVKRARDSSADAIMTLSRELATGARL